MPSSVALVLIQARRQSLLHEAVLLVCTGLVWVGAAALAGLSWVVVVLPLLFVVPGVAAVVAQRFVLMDGHGLEELPDAVSEAVRSAGVITGVDPDLVRVLVVAASPGGRELPHPVRVVGSPRRPLVILGFDAMELPIEELTALMVHEFGHVAAGHLSLRHRVVSAGTQRLAAPIGLALFVSSAASDWWFLAGTGYACVLVGYQWSILRCRADGLTTVDGLPSRSLLMMLATGLGTWYLPLLFVAWGGMSLAFGWWGFTMFAALRCLWLGLAQRSETHMDDVAAAAGLSSPLSAALEQLGGRQPGVLQRVFTTHPPTALRVRRLRRSAMLSR